MKSRRAEKARTIDTLLSIAYRYVELRGPFLIVGLRKCKTLDTIRIGASYRAGGHTCFKILRHHARKDQDARITRSPYAFLMSPYAATPVLLPHDSSWMMILLLMSILCAHVVTSPLAYIVACDSIFLRCARY